MTFDKKSYKELLENISRVHSYSSGFNGRLSKYRAILLEKFFNSYPKFANTLEVGCSEGELTSLIAKYSDKLLAIEPSLTYLNNTKSKLSLPNVQFQQCILEEFKSDYTFDLIVATGVLEHTQDDNYFLEKIRYLLNTEGKLVITVPNATSLHRRIGLQLGYISDIHELAEIDHSVGHFRYYSSSTLVTTLKEAGFQLECLEGIMLKPLINTEMDKLSEDYCDALFSIGLELPEYAAEIFAVFHI